MPFGGLLTVGLIGAGSSIFGGLFGKSAADNASKAQVAEQEKALQQQQSQFEQTQQNFAPFLGAGQQSIAQLMQQIQSGKFGAGSTGSAPQFTGGDFHAPTLAEARTTPGYQFTQEQGNKGILSGAAAAGGAISGGTLKALGQFNTNLADTTYNDVFNRALATYNTGLSKYQTQLAGYGAGLAGQNQEFNQEIAPIQIGSGSAAQLATAGQNNSTSIANLMTGIGNAQASGIVGGANALSSGLNNATTGITQSLLLNKLLGKGGGYSGLVGPGITSAPLPEEVPG